MAALEGQPLRTLYMSISLSVLLCIGFLGVSAQQEIRQSVAFGDRRTAKAPVVALVARGLLVGFLFLDGHGDFFKSVGKTHQGVGCGIYLRTHLLTCKIAFQDSIDGTIQGTLDASGDGPRP